MPVLALIVLGWFGLLERRFWLVLPVILLGLPSALEDKQVKRVRSTKGCLHTWFSITSVYVKEKEHAVQHHFRRTSRTGSESSH